MSDPRHQLSKTFISNVELEAIKKKNADLQFCLDKEVARVMALTQQNAELLSALIRTERKLSAYVGVCTGDKELLLTVLPMAREAIAKAGGEV